jgi:hypothetical protein
MLVELVQCKLVNLLEDLCDASGSVKFYMQQREPFSWRMAKTLDEI